MQYRIAVVAVIAALCCVDSTGPLQAQRPAQEQQAHEQLLAELARLRDAAARESAGDLAGAERLTREVLQQNPISLTALLTLERLVGLQGRLEEMVPLMSRLLETDPTSIIGHQMRLRVFGALGDVGRLENAITAWTKATPSLEPPYREGAASWRQRGDHARAISLLEQGRRKIDRSDALALELGDAYAAAGDAQRAAAEWSRAVGAEGRGFLLVQRRLQNLPDGGARIIPTLVDQLAGEPVSTGRQKAAALLAIEAGLEGRAQRLAKDVAAIARMDEREALLVELARRADGAGLHRVAAWAYTELLRDAKELGSSLAIRTRIAELALAAGDTALAAQTYRQLEQAAAAGSPQRRQAIALRIQLGAREGDIDRAAADLAGFRAEYPQAPELDQTATMIAVRYLERGDVKGAERVLGGVAGPHSARTRGSLFLRTGDLPRARDELLTAAPMLQGRAATETIALAALLARVSARGGEIVARVVAAPDADRTRLILDAVAEAEKLPANERAAVLDFLATAAERSGIADEADVIRRMIVATLPRTQEAPAALLALARSALQRGAATDEVRVLLEKLILEYPRSALLPQARSELQRLQPRINAK